MCSKKKTTFLTYSLSGNTITPVAIGLLRSFHPCCVTTAVAREFTNVGRWQFRWVINLLPIKLAA